MRIESVEEHYIRANIITPTTYDVPIISMCQHKHGYQATRNNLAEM